MDAYVWIKAVHVIAVIAWMAGVLYLPRLYVYHSDTRPGSPESEMLKVMERRLLRAIVTPAMIVVWLLGIALILWDPTIMSQGWLHAKLLLVLILSGMTGAMSAWRKSFERDERKRQAKFYRVMNEVPTLLMIGIVILVIVKPF
ncbi:protoporphyrinogen oxidase HemJ [Zavarzinia sp. CC-PAN008]|uniref:protoporphyrinogen oxidase HemJ n=1 Tax=Zavarzinia sp. CC-PAN008 TaxID=3243332 RepID=UPI003F742D49